MDEFVSDNLTAADLGVPAGAAIDKTASALKNIAGNIRNKAKAKKAQKISDAGGYLTLTPFQKSLIPVPNYVGTQLQNISQATGTAATVDQVQNLPPIPATEGQIKEKVKGYLPYILGVIVLGIVIYFVVKKS